MKGRAAHNVRCVEARLVADEHPRELDAIRTRRVSKGRALKAIAAVHREAGVRERQQVPQEVGATRVDGQV